MENSAMAWLQSILKATAKYYLPSFCLIEVKAMVVALQQPLAECTAIFTVCIV